MIDKSEKEKQIKPACRSCRSKPCEELYWKDSLVFPDIFAVPFDCPLRVEDELQFCRELQWLSEYDVSRISGDVWIKHNYGPRYVYTDNHKVEEIEYLLSHFRQKKCVMIARSADPCYQPWTLFGFWANSGGGYSFQDSRSSKAKEEEITDGMADESPKEQARLKITSISWQHTDSGLRKESPDIVHNGDAIELQAQFENYIDGAGVDFFVYGNVNGTKKQALIFLCTVM